MPADEGSAARAAILGRVRRSLAGSGLARDKDAALAERLAAHPRNLIPARAALPPAERAALFRRMAEANLMTVAEVGALAEVPGAVAAYLAAENLPASLVAAGDPRVAGLDWDAHPLLTIRHGAAHAEDAVGLTIAHAGIAETGTLMLVSAPETPTTINFVPETEIVLLEAGAIAGSMEDGFDRLRARMGGTMPRAINFVSGPSRTGDIELRMHMGAHGPKRVHVVIVGGPDG